MAESVLDRSATHLLEALGRKLWGFTPRLMPEIVKRLGGLGALGWFVADIDGPTNAMVIGTDPPAGAVRDKGSPIRIFTQQN